MFPKTIVVNKDRDMNSYPYDPHYISEKYKIIANIKATNQQLDCHPICSILTTKSRIEAYILYHIFDAWDTNKLLLPLQSKIRIASLKKSNKYHYELKRLLKSLSLLYLPACESFWSRLSGLLFYRNALLSILSRTLASWE
jgi:hypothetical protein